MAADAPPAGAAGVSLIVPTRILIVGGGGREHALAWKLAAEPGVNEIVVAPGSDAMVAMMSRTSANCGKVFAGRNEPTSKCRTPAAYSSRIQRCFASVDGNFFTSCRPSRRPTSRRITLLAG